MPVAKVDRGALPNAQPCNRCTNIDARITVFARKRHQKEISGAVAGSSSVLIHRSIRHGAEEIRAWCRNATFDDGTAGAHEGVGDNILRLVRTN